MKNKEVFEVVKILGKEKNISEEALLVGIQKALVTAIKRDYNNKDVVFCEIDRENNNIKVFVRKRVVEEVLSPDEELTVEQARKFKKDASPGDVVEIELETKKVSRIAAEKGKHIIRQAIREAERYRIREEFQKKDQEIVTAKVIRVDPANRDAIIEIGKIVEKLLRREQLPSDNFAPGDIIKVYVAEVADIGKGTIATLSRVHPGIIRRLFEKEIPEIFDGTVRIKSMAREAGSRSKVAVYSSDDNVDPVGACIGQRGERINRIIEVLNGEKLDIVPYSDDPVEFIASSLAPAQVVYVTVVNERDRVCTAIVPNSQLSLAIGNRGQNVRLAARLTGWRIDIRPETEEPVINFDE